MAVSAHLLYGLLFPRVICRMPCHTVIMCLKVYGVIPISEEAEPAIETGGAEPHVPKTGQCE